MNDLDSLASATAEADSLDAPQTTNPQEAQAMDEAGQWAAFLEGIVSMSAPVFPVVRVKYPEPYVRTIAEPLSQLAKKYGWSPGALPPEVMLPILVVAPWIPEIIAHVKAKKAAKEKQVTGEKEAPVTQ